MQQEWDDLDRLIENSNEEIRVSDSYNYKLMSKMKRKKQVRNQSYTFAFSLIMAGFLIMFMYTSDIQYKLVDIQCRIKSNVTFLQSNINILNNLRGE
jgi:hypothetical protein